MYKTVAILRTEYKHSKIDEKFLKKFKIIEYKVLKPIFKNIEDKYHICDIAVLMSSLSVKAIKINNLVINSKFIIPVGEDTYRELMNSLENFTGKIILPSHYSSYGIVGKIREIQKNHNINIVNIYRSDHGSKVIRELLRDLKICEYSLYSLNPNDYVIDIFLKNLEYVDIIIPMSSLTIKCVLDRAKRWRLDTSLKEKIVVCPGPEVYGTCISHNFKKVYLANNAKLDNIFQTLEYVLENEVN